MEELRKDNVGEERDLSLGKKIGISDFYDPKILRAVPRIDNRKDIKGLQDKAMPFHGFDVWNCYEFSFLDLNGVPKNYCLKITYSCSSECIVESKSLKLYLGSFTQEKYKDINEVIEVITKDLEKLLETKVEVEWYTNAFANWDTTGFQHLDEIAGTVVCKEYQRNPNLLEEFKSETKEAVKVWSDSLRSNCRVTHQPDEGDIYIEMVGEKVPTYSSLLKYIVSFRKEYHFHEEIVETIYADLNERFHPEKLVVAATYLRRGGISICPVRFNSFRCLTNNKLVQEALGRFRFASRRD